MNDKTPLRELKGVGDKTEKLFQKIGITTTEELLRYYPRTYDVYEEPVEIASAEEEKTVSIRGTITGSLYSNQVRNLQILTTTVADQSGRLPVAWFNAPYLKGTLKKGSVFIFRGKIIRKKGRLQMEHPEIFTPAAYEEVVHSMQPVYVLTKGLTNKAITKLVRQVLDTRPLKTEYLPEEIRERYQLADDNFAIRTIHFPGNMQELLTARKRLVFDEFLLFVLAVQLLKEKTEEAPNTFSMKPVWTTEEIIEGLPYELTNAQKNVWHEIERDLSGHKLMSRLVQGDVGSGKTVIAFLSMVLSAENGFQSALMVPTEVLANQHYEGFLRLMEEQNITSCHPVLLTGSSTAKQKREIYQKIAEGEANVIIGTHALIQEKVEYKNLGLVITDEQHRFGVRQREALTTRGNPPHVLVMSATPIPRTLAIILYGDLDISILDELPPGRKPIKTWFITGKKRRDMYGFLEKQIAAGHQVYIVCPAIEENEMDSGMKAVKQYYEQVACPLLPGRRIGLLHGKMKPKDKDEVMQQFKAGELDVLVSTTVIEVGVDVPNATVMVIENAERFGLSALHQLRGRVGRGAANSCCILISDNEGEAVRQRLHFLCRTSDGFAVAKYDLETRGPGDFFGEAQHGLPTLHVADLVQDTRTLTVAQQEAKALLALDPNLAKPEHKALSDEVERLFATAGAMN